MNTLILATSNKHKFQEINSMAKNFNLKIKMKKINLNEPESSSLKKIAEFKAIQAFKIIKKPLIVEDTGVFFEEYSSFPGLYPKRVYLSLGFKGLLRLIKPAKNKKAYFKTVVCYIDRKKIKCFEGILKGRLTNRVYDKNKNVLPYEKIFKPENYNLTLSSISRKEKNMFSHRAKAVKKFFVWYAKNELK